MLSARNKFVLAVFVFAILFSIWALAGYPIEGQICEDAKQSIQGQCSSHYPLMFGILFADKHHDFFLVLGTFILASMVLFQVREARFSSERQLRAYVTTSPGQGFRQSRILRFEFRPVILNTGQTPAYEINVISQMRFLSLEEATTFDFTLGPVEAAAVTTLGPRQDRFTQVIFERRLSKAELRQYKRGTHRLFVYGRINYRDAFERLRYTNYCYVIAWWLKPGPPIWHFINRHNDSN